MSKITFDMTTGTASPVLFALRASEIAGAYAGAPVTGTVADAYAVINPLLSAAGVAPLLCGEEFGTAVAKLNIANDPATLLQAQAAHVGGTAYIADPRFVFQTEAGVTQATIGGTVGGLRAAVSGGAVIASQANSGFRPTFARAPVTGVNNILAANTTDITAGAGWSGFRAGVAAATTIAGEPATRVTATETNVNGSARLVIQTLGAGTYRLSFVVRGAGFVALRTSDDASFSDAVQAWFNLSTGALGEVNAAGGSSKITTPVAAITAVGDGYRVSLTFTVTASTPVSLRLYVTDANSNLAVISGAFVDVEAPQLVSGSTELAYQRRVSAFDVTEAGQRSVFSVAPDGVDDFLSLATTFAPTGGYTILAAGLWAVGFPAFMPFGSVGGLSNVNMGSSVSVVANTSANQINFAATAGWPVLTTGARRVEVIRVSSASAGQAWRNNTPYPASPTVTGNATPVAGLNTMFRVGGSYSGTRLIAAVPVPSAIADTQLFAMKRVMARIAGVTLA